MASIPSDGFARESDGTTEPVRTAQMAAPEPAGCTPGWGQGCHNDSDESAGEGSRAEADGGGGTPGWGNPKH